MIIGLQGVSGCGKDTVAKILVDQYGFTRKAFADPVRDLVYGLNPNVATRENVSLPLREIIDKEGWPNAQRVHPNVRLLLQRFATEFVRDTIDPLFWVKLSMYGVTQDDHIVFSDVRFQNEVDAIKKLRGVNVLVRNNVAEMNRMAHSSENQQIGSIIELDNNGTLTDLYNSVEKMVNFAFRLQNQNLNT